MNFRARQANPLTALAATALLTAAAVNADQASSTVELDGIEHIYLLGPHSLVITQGDREQVTVTTDEEYLDEARAQIKGKTLALGEQKSSFWGWVHTTPDWRAHFEVTLRRPRSVSNLGSGEITVKPIETQDDFALENKGSGDIHAESLTVRTLEMTGMGSGDLHVGETRARRAQIKGMGSGDTRVDSLAAQDVDVDLMGSGDLEIGGGAADELNVTITGSGDVDSSDLETQRVRVKILGSGEVELYAGQELDVDIFGSGDVTYRGQPATIHKSITGSGQVEPRD